MDLSSIKPGERTIEIEHPATGAPLGIRVGIVSLDDDRLKRLKRNITDESLKLQAKGKAFKVEELERNSKSLLFGATTRWEWYNPTGKEGDEGYDAKAMPDFNGEIPEYNQKNFNAVIEALPWFADQLREALEDTKGFFDNSPGS